MNITTTVKAITPELASILLKGNVANRPLNRVTIEDYKAQMQKGLWKLNGEPIILSSSGALLDGQHRLKAVEESGVTVPMLIVEGVDTDSFATIDTGRIRTPGDVFNIEGVPNAVQISAIVSSYFMVLQNNTACATRNNLRRLKVSKTELLSFYNQHRSAVEEALKLSARCRRKLPLLRASEIGGLSLYLQLNMGHSQVKVETFFEALHELINSPNDTISLLRGLLVKAHFKNISLPTSVRRAYIIKTWNSYVKGKELKVLTYNKEREGNITFI